MGWLKDTFAPDVPTRLRKKKEKTPLIMAKMSESERTFFLLRMHGHSHDVIAIKMGIGLDTVLHLEQQVLRK